MPASAKVITLHATTDWKARAEMFERRCRRLTARVEHLEEALGQGTEYRNIPTLAATRLTDKEAQILGLLMARSYVQRDAVYTLLYGSRPNGDRLPVPKILDIFVFNLRQKLRRLCGARIESLPKWSYGWYLTSDAKKRIREALWEEK